LNRAVHHLCHASQSVLCQGAGQVSMHAWRHVACMQDWPKPYIYRCIRCVYGILAGKSPYIRPYTVNIYGPGQPQLHGIAIAAHRGDVKRSVVLSEYCAGIIIMYVRRTHVACMGLRLYSTEEV
jgi:hypothetical protein